MARKISRRERILLSLLGIAAVVYLGYQQTRDQVAPLEKIEQEAQVRGDEEAPIVHLDLLQVAGEGYDPDGRDLFQYSQRPPSAAELAAIAAEQRRQRELQRQAEEARLAYEKAQREAAEREAVLAASRPRPPPPPPQPPPISFKFVGYLGPKDHKIATFQNGNELIQAKEGEVFLDQFKLVAINYDAAVIGFTRPEFRNQTRELPLTQRR